MIEYIAWMAVWPFLFVLMLSYYRHKKILNRKEYVNLQVFTFALVGGEFITILAILMFDYGLLEFLQRHPRAFMAALALILIYEYRRL